MHVMVGAEHRVGVVGNVTSVAGNNRVTIGSGLISRLDALSGDPRIARRRGSVWR
jgi:hypothetical protein